MNWLSLAGPTIASIVALTIAVLGWKRQDRRDEQDRDEATKQKQAQLLADLLELCVAAGGVPEDPNASRAKAILLRLPGHLATVIRPALGLEHTMQVPVDAATAARLGMPEPIAGYKWLIFDRSSAVTNRSFAARRDWIEAEILYDIAGLMGDDQDAVLATLKMDVRDMNVLIRRDIQQHRAAKETSDSK